MRSIRKFSDRPSAVAHAIRQGAPEGVRRSLAPRDPQNSKYSSGDTNHAGQCAAPSASEEAPRDESADDPVRHDECCRIGPAMAVSANRLVRGQQLGRRNGSAQIAGDDLRCVLSDRKQLRRRRMRGTNASDFCEVSPAP